MATTFSNKCRILGQLVADDYDEYEHLKKFIAYNNLGLPLAYAYSEKFAIPTDSGISEIEETWKSFLDCVSTKDTGFASLQEILEPAE